MYFLHNMKFNNVNRNLSFETDEDSLATSMSQFGDISYCRLVLDPTTEHSRG